MNIALIHPTEELEKEIVDYYPIRYHYHTDGDNMIITCDTCTKDPFTGDCMLTLKTTYHKISLYVKSGTCEDIRKWGV